MKQEFLQHPVTPHEWDLGSYVLRSHLTLHLSIGKSAVSWEAAGLAPSCPQCFYGIDGACVWEALLAPGRATNRKGLAQLGLCERLGPGGRSRGHSPCLSLGDFW